MEPDDTSILANTMSSRVLGQSRGIAQLVRSIENWQAEPEPRFPLRLLFMGPSGVGKQHLAETLANTMFEGRIVVQYSKASAQLRLNRKLLEHAGKPGVLLFKIFDENGLDMAAIELLFGTGGIVLGNGSAINLAGWVVVLSAGDVYSQHLCGTAGVAPADKWAMALDADFPELARRLDGVVQFDDLAVETLAEIAHLTAADLSEEWGFPLALTDSAAHSIASESNARWIDRSIRFAAADSGWDLETAREMGAEGGALLIDCINDDLTADAVAVEDLPVSRGPAGDLSPAAPSPELPFDPPRRPEKFPALDWKPDHRFDAFISYKFRNHRQDARDLAEALGRQGLQVWLDHDQIGMPEDRETEWSMEELIERLAEGVARSRCTIVFEAALEAIAWPDDQSREHLQADALKRHKIMHSEGGFVAWNWQKLEIDASTLLIVIRPNAPWVTVARGGLDITASVLRGQPLQDENVLGAVSHAVRYFRA